jgi:hypothetical protein
MDLTAVKANVNSLLKLALEQLVVPQFQRAYSWTDEQVDDLWQDVLDNIDSGHFIGSVVLSKVDTDSWHVIDGQQRLTTIVLLLAAIRDHYARLEDPAGVNQVQAFFIRNAYAQGDAKYRLKTGQANWRFLRHAVIAAPEDPDRWSPDTVLSPEDKAQRARNKPLLDNYAALSRWIGAYISSAPGGLEELAALRKLEEFVALRIEFVVIKVEKLSDAFLLFETLNDRGLRLSAADLLKSHLLGEIAQQHKNSEDESAVQVASEQWETMLKSLGPRVEVSRFLRHFLLSYLPRVKKDDVFDEFKSLVKELGPRAVLDGLTKAAGFYAELEDPGRNSTHPQIQQALSDLKELHATSCYIALLPARMKLTDNQFLSLARLTEIVTFRYSSVVGLVTNDLERVYSDVARSMHEAGEDALPEVRARLIAIMPDSDQFIASFKTLQLGQQFKLRYTLRKLAEHETTGEIKPPSEVHLEHVMPQTATQEWLNSLGEDADRYDELVSRWGNVTLLDYKINSSISNGSFAKKRIDYLKSKIVDTLEIAKLPSWGVVEIEARQADLAHRADALWAKPGA